jgi:hypothetical protein
MAEVVEREPNALAFLRAVYLNRTLPLPTRMRAAEAAPEKPKLAAIMATSLSGEDFGLALERARKRLAESPRTNEELELRALPRPGLSK